MGARATKFASSGPEKSPLFVSDKVPLYYQLQSILTDKILSGSLAPGYRLPTEAMLVEEYGVSRITVRQALGAMEEEGLIRREVGRGTFVNKHRPFRGMLQLEGSMDDLITLGLTTTVVKVLHIATVKASAAEAKVLGLEPGALLVRCARVRSYRNQPYSHVVNDLPYEIGRRLTRSNWKGSVSRVLQEKLGIPLLEARQSIRASLANAELARLLSIRIGAPLLSVDRVVMTTNGRPVDHVRTHYRSDIFCFNVHLRKDHPRENWRFKPRQKSS
jgi:GntR family transcriptional regulator